MGTDFHSKVEWISKKMHKMFYGKLLEFQDKGRPDKILLLVTRVQISTFNSPIITGHMDFGYGGQILIKDVVFNNEFLNKTYIRECNRSETIIFRLRNNL